MVKAWTVITTCSVYSSAWNIRADPGAKGQKYSRILVRQNGCRDDLAAPWPTEQRDPSGGICVGAHRRAAQSPDTSEGKSKPPLEIFISYPTESMTVVSINCPPIPPMPRSNVFSVAVEADPALKIVILYPASACHPLFLQSQNSCTLRL